MGKWLVKGDRITEDNCWCLNCGKGFRTKPCAIKRGRGKYCCKNCYGEHKSLLFMGEGNPQYGQHWGVGENNPNWKGGISREPYSFNFTSELKKLIRKRDNYRCRNCGTLEEDFGRNLSIHHIDYNKQNCNPTNLVTVCASCNSKANFNREYWTKYYMEEVMPNA